MNSDLKTSENVYQPPAESDLARQTTLSRDEWRYAARVFGYWVVGTSIVFGIFLTIRTVTALKAFGAGSYSAGIILVSVLWQMGPRAVAFAACSALVMVVETRSKRQMRPPTKIVYSPAILGLYGALFIANGLISVTSLLVILIFLNGSMNEIWESLSRTVLFDDFIGGIFVLSSVIAILGFAGRYAMQLVAKRQGGAWLALKLFVALQMCGLLTEWACFTFSTIRYALG